ncbi:MAG TPA: hypothetical protein VG869_08705 [Acidimicrobiia bacterium]|nr:hypothetical protein [Acidimicrobiia bacterium]
MSAGASGPRLERARFRSLGLGLLVLGFLFVVALVLGLSARVAQACDPVTGVGCDTTPSTAASSPQPSGVPPQGATQSPSGSPSDNGQPFIPPTSAPAAAPTTTVAPATPTTASPATDQPSGSSGDLPWDWLLGGGALTVTGLGATGLAVRNRKKPDPLVDYTQTCDDLCFSKQVEAQAESDAAAAQAELAQIDQAYFKALDYLDNQLRQQYLSLRRIHQGAAITLTLLPFAAAIPFGLGPALLGVAGSAGVAASGALDANGNEASWNAQVNAEMKSGHALIDSIHDQNRAPWQAKLDAAQQRQNEAFNNRHAAEYHLVELRAANPQVEFPACGCEG